MELYYAYGILIILFLFLFQSSTVPFQNILCDVSITRFCQLSIRSCNKTLAHYYLVYFLVSIKPLIRVSYLVTFGSRLCFEDPSSKKWPEQLPQRFDPTTSRSAICHNSIGTTRKSRFQPGACRLNVCWPRATFPSSATQPSSWEVCQVDLWRRF